MGPNGNLYDFELAWANIKNSTSQAKRLIRRTRKKTLNGLTMNRLETALGIFEGESCDESNNEVKGFPCALEPRIVSFECHLWGGLGIQWQFGNSGYRRRGGTDSKVLGIGSKALRNPHLQ